MSRISTSGTALEIAVLAAGLFSSTAWAAIEDFHALLNETSEVPTHTVKGASTAIAMLNTATKILTYTMTYQDLTGTATAAHFHGPAMAGANAPPVVPMANPMSPIKGSATLTDAQIADLEAGKWHVNVHTAANVYGGDKPGQWSVGAVLTRAV